MHLETSDGSASIIPPHIKAACHGSLKRLGVDKIDLYFLHRQNPDVPIEDSMAVMLDLIEEGKITLASRR